MHIIDLTIFFLYMLAMLGFGFFFFQKNKKGDDYYAGGRNMGSTHVGLSVVATDVGGGFSIGLGGLGFVMGLSGSWMLFTGLVGAWLAVVFLIPKIKRNKAFKDFLTLPQIFDHYYGRKVALMAGLISAIGYAGFTSSQILAGAKLANGTFANLDLNTALMIMGVIAVLYTVMGGLKAVIYTDTLQWALLMFGLILIGIPLSFLSLGGVQDFQFENLVNPNWLSEHANKSTQVLRDNIQPGFLTLSNISWQEMVNWAITIIPIWFVGMTLYQRIYACRDEKTAKKAWILAGFFEYPIMAFIGVTLGMFSRVAADLGMFDYLGAANISATDPETGLPMLLRTVLPVGFLGIMMSAYFSAILSTADSCMMASSGNVVSDIIGHFKKMDPNHKSFIRTSQIVTLIIGGGALWLATSMTNVLDLMLYSYAFMVSGLLVPILGALYWKKSNSRAAFSSMLLGGGTTLLFQTHTFSLSKTASKQALISRAHELSSLFPSINNVALEQKSKEGLFQYLQDITQHLKIIHIDWLNLKFILPYNLDANIYGITVSLLVFVILSLIYTKNTK